MDGTKTGTLETTDTVTSLGDGHKVILYNDQTHMVEEVISQVMKAAGCSEAKAERITLEAHNKGRAMVIAAHLERCEHVASVLEQIGLRTDIE